MSIINEVEWGKRTTMVVNVKLYVHQPAISFLRTIGVQNCGEVSCLVMAVSCALPINSGNVFLSFPLTLDNGTNGNDTKKT